jgi:2-dehydro-3-deoxygalactonokinase
LSPFVNDAALIAVDWGTTAARAFLVARDGRTLATREAPLGIQAIRDGRFAPALDALLGDWRTLALRRLAAGMIGSRQGWIEVPYARCPASAADLSGALGTTPGGELVIVPGLMARGDDGLPDVMRGEETQLVGAVDDGEDVLAVLPGTHSKWAHVAGGRIDAFATFMTGELYAVLRDHSILGRLAVARGGDEPRPAFADGVRQGLAGGALSHLAFGARTRALAGELPGANVADWLSGLLIGYELHHARAWARSRVAAKRVRVIGSASLVDRYRSALALAGFDAEPGPADAAVRGLVRIARHAGWTL